MALLAMSYQHLTALDKTTALDTLTDPNKNIKNLLSQCKGQSMSDKIQVKWLTEITGQGHVTAGHSPTDAPAALVAIPRTHCHLPNLQSSSHFLDLDL